MIGFAVVVWIERRGYGDICCCSESLNGGDGIAER